MAEDSRSSFAQLPRYAFVGIVSNLAGYLVYLLVTYLGATPKLTMTLLYGIGAAISFSGNRRFTFSDKGRVVGSGIRYAMAQLLGYLLNFLILWIFVDKLGQPHQLVQFVAIFVVAGFLFASLKLFVFRDARNSKSTESIPGISTRVNSGATRRAWRHKTRQD